MKLRKIYIEDFKFLLRPFVWIWKKGIIKTLVTETVVTGLLLLSFAIGFFGTNFIQTICAENVALWHVNGELVRILQKKGQTCTKYLSEPDVQRYIRRSS